MMFRLRVTAKSTRPRPKADSVLALSNSWSPTSSVAICTVTVLTASSGLPVRLAASGGHHHDHGLADCPADRQQHTADDAGQRCGENDVADGFRLCGAKAVRAIAERLGHRVDDVVRQRTDEGDDHDAHDDTGRQRRFRTDVQTEAVAYVADERRHGGGGEEAV